MDPNRLAVSHALLHHAVTPLWDDKSKAWLAQWFSDNGFARAYGSNPANWSGLINPFTGERSYSQTHAVGQRVTDRTPDATAAERKAGYRVFFIVKNPESVITWHAANWEMNRKSIAVENLGDYRNYPLRDGDIRVLADWWRPFDRKRNGNTYILGHLEVVATICPARIMEGRSLMIKYVNEGSNAPAPKPAPAPAPAPKPPAGNTIKVGSTVRPTRAQSYEGVWLNSSVLTKNYPVIEVRGSRVVLGGGLNTAFNISSLRLISGGGSSGGSTGGSTIRVGSTVRPTRARSFEGVNLSQQVLHNNYPVIELKGSRAVLGAGLNTAFNVSDLRLISGGGSAPAKPAPAPAPKPAGISVGNRVVVTNPVDINGTRLGVSGNYDVMEVSQNGNRIVIGRGGVVTAAMHKNNVRRV